MSESELTTIQISKETRDKLRVLAELENRSMASQMDFMVTRDLKAAGMGLIVVPVSPNVLAQSSSQEQR